MRKLHETCYVNHRSRLHHKGQCWWYDAEMVEIINIRENGYIVRPIHRDTYMAFFVLEIDLVDELPELKLTMKPSRFAKWFLLAALVGVLISFSLQAGWAIWFSFIFSYILAVEFVKSLNIKRV